MDTLVSIIGSGNIGRGLATLANAGGVSAAISNSRGPQSLAELVAPLQHVRAASTVDALEHASLAILAIPISALGGLPVTALEGKVVIDAMNYNPQRFGHIDALDQSGLTSSEYVQRQLPLARVVKALNNVDYLRLPRLAKPHGDPQRSALPIAGDDTHAKSAAMELLDLLGFDVLDLGGLSEGWRTQPGTPLYVTPYQHPSDPTDPTETDPAARFFNAETVPVPYQQAQHLAAAAQPSHQSSHQPSHQAG